MSIGFMFLFNSVLLGVGLAMDAFSVSLANGLNEPQMGTRRMCGIAGVFAFFQALMPMTGWVCIHTIVSHFQAFEKLIPWIALVLLLYIGGSMLKEGLAGGGAEEERCGVGLWRYSYRVLRPRLMRFRLVLRLRNMIFFLLFWKR